MRRIARRPYDARAGYTLTEMLVVLAIISLIAAVLTPNVFGQLGRARARAAAMQIDTVTANLEMLRTDIGRYPTTNEGLRLLTDNPQQIPGWLGPYAQSTRALTDPWGRPLMYEQNGEAGYRLTTLGADGKRGGVSVNVDLVAER